MSTAIPPGTEAPDEHSNFRRDRRCAMTTANFARTGGAR